MTEILWVDPVGHGGFFGDIEALFQSAARDSTSVDVASLDRGPHHVEYHCYEALVTPDVLHTVKRAENNGYDATVIGCFYDLGLEAAREVSSAMPVATPAEATTHLVAVLGALFFAAVGRQKRIPQMCERIHAYSFRGQLASFRPVNLGVPDFQDDPETTKSRLRDAARSAVEEDGAEVIILSCTAEYGSHEELQSDFGVPVLDAVTAPFKYVELLTDLTGLGWTHSKVGGYESPRPDEIICWGITDNYLNTDVWSDEEAT